MLLDIAMYYLTRQRFWIFVTGFPLLQRQGCGGGDFDWSSISTRLEDERKSRSGRNLSNYKPRENAFAKTNRSSKIYKGRGTADAIHPDFNWLRQGPQQIPWANLKASSKTGEL